jgi:hypothetical protein
VLLPQFEKACAKCGVSFSDYETKKLIKQYGQEFGDDTYLLYKQLSMNLGLHKQSYNYLQSLQKMNKMKNISKLKQLYGSIEPSDDKSVNSLALRTRNNKSSTGLYPRETSIEAKKVP